MGRPALHAPRAEWHGCQRLVAPFRLSTPLPSLTRRAGAPARLCQEAAWSRAAGCTPSSDAHETITLWYVSLLPRRPFHLAKESRLCLPPTRSPVSPTRAGSAE